MPFGPHVTCYRLTNNAGRSLVAVVPTAPGAACATTLFTDALGPPQQLGGVLVWSKVNTKL